MATAKERLQDSVLNRRGLERSEVGKLVVTDGTQFAKRRSKIPDSNKTTLMKVLETSFDEPIEELISLKFSLISAAKRLGITESCVSRWRLQLGMRDRVR
jgi:hypothetical protein